MSRAAMNKEYYGISLARSQFINTWMDTIIAIGTTGSGISALTIWNTQYGKVIWGTLSAVSTLFALAKPIIQLSKKIERQSRLFTGHSDNYTNLLVLASRIRRYGNITDEMNRTLEAAETRFAELSRDDDPQPNLRLLRRCEQAVRKRHPPEAAWYPEARDDAQRVAEMTPASTGDSSGNLQKF